jgi:serine protein kinase
MENKSTGLAKYIKQYNRDEYLTLHEKMTFSEYVVKLEENPKLCRNSFQYVYDMIMSKGSSTFERYRKTYIHYNFFDDPEVPIFGLEETLDALVNFVHGAAGGYGTEKRVLLLHGPVGSSKSTICRLIKKGLERYSKTPEGAWYSFRWINLPFDGPNAIHTSSESMCPIHEDPIRLLPRDIREEIFANLNKSYMQDTVEADKKSQYTLQCEGDMCPRCKIFMDLLLKQYDGDWEAILNKHIEVIRMTHSEIDRIGIGTFQPKDEKNQDSTELTGDIDFSKIGHFGADSDARSFNFDGEFCIANRGIMEFIEMLKLDNAFLYDLLSVSQEHRIKPKKFAQVYVDEFVVGHTNGPEFEKMKANRYMEALCDRTVKIDVPYLLRWSDELKVLEKDYNPNRVKQHIMPHTLEIVAFFAVLTRMHDEKETKLDLRDKVKLYDGRSLPGWTEDSVKELRDKYPEEGLKGGLSSRFMQDKISNCLAKHKDYVNVFHVLNEMKKGLYESTLVDVEHLKRYEDCLDLAIKELQDILKHEVQKALVADETLVERICNKYIDNIVAYVNDEKVVNPITNLPQAADERLMRNIEEKIDVPEQGADDFRRSLAAYIGTLAARKKEFRWDSNPELRKALEAHIFELTKDTIKISTLSSEAAKVDPDLQEKIEAIKTRLIKQYGYNDQSARDVLDYVSSLFSLGSATEK